MATVVAVNIKRRKKIKPSSQGKVCGIKWNLLSLMFCLDFLFESLLYCIKLLELNRMQGGRR